MDSSENRCEDRISDRDDAQHHDPGTQTASSASRQASTQRQKGIDKAPFGLHQRLDALLSPDGARAIGCLGVW